MRAGHLGLVLLSLVAVGCSSKKKATTENAPTPKAATATSASAAPSASAATASFKLPPSSPGAAYFLFDRYDTGRITSILPDGTTGTVPGKFSMLVRGGDGAAYALRSAGGGPEPIVKIVGNKVTPVSTSPFPVWRLHVTSDGAVHVFQDGKFASYDGKKWVKGECPISQPENAALDSAGRLWIKSLDALAYREGTTWTLVKDALSLKSLGRLGDEALFVDYSDVKKLVLDVDHAPTVTSLGSASITYASFTPTVLLLSHYKSSENATTMWLVAPGGSSTSKPGDADHALVDGSGRVWSLEDGVLKVVPMLEGTPTEYPISTLPIVEQAHSSFSFHEDAVVLGAGPTLPPPGPVRTTSVKGRLLLAGVAAKNVAMQICVGPKLLKGAKSASSPCAGKKSSIAITTDDKGAFAHENVPVATYGLAIERDGDWSVTPSSDFSHLRPGKVSDLGTLSFR